jgi:hypothetical protein
MPNTTAASLLALQSRQQAGGAGGLQLTIPKQTIMADAH